MSDSESNSNSNSSSSSNSSKSVASKKSNKPANKPANKPKRQITEKVRQLFQAREKVRANLTAKLGKGALVANAATFYKQYPTAENRATHINSFVTSIRERNAKKAANKAQAPPKQKTAKKNKVPAAPAPAPAPTQKKVKTATAKRGRPVLPNAYKKNKSIERQAEKLVKKAEAVQKELDKVNLKLSDLCDLCKDFQPETPKKA